MAHLLIVEGNLPEDELAVKRALGATPAQRLARMLKASRVNLTFSFANPWFSDHDPDALSMDGVDGVVATGGLVPWSVSDVRARPMQQVFETAFATGLPVFASGWSMQAAVSVLGAAVGPASGAAEIGIARALRPTDHPMMKGRRSSFDAISLHTETVVAACASATITASNESCPIQAVSVADGEVRFTGTQYQPELGLADLAVLLGKGGHGASRAARAVARDFQAVASDPAGYPRLCAKHRIGVDVLDQDYRMTELRNWLDHIDGA